MSIRFRCPNCAKKLKAHDEQAGTPVLCSGCGQTMLVPGAAAAAPPAPVAAQPAATASGLPPVQRMPAAPSPPDMAARAAAPSPADEGPEPPLTLGKRTPMDDELDMTPMIDMTFLLLIFFMVTASFSLQKSIPIPPPDVTENASQSRAPKEPDEEDDYIQVQVKRDDSVWVNGSLATSRQELIAQLKQARAGDGAGSGARNLLVMASEECHHEVVVMVMDAGTAARLEKIRLAPSGDDE